MGPFSWRRIYITKYNYVNSKRIPRMWTTVKNIKYHAWSNQEVPCHTLKGSDPEVDFLLKGKSHFLSKLSTRPEMWVQIEPVGLPLGSGLHLIHRVVDTWSFSVEIKSPAWTSPGVATRNSIGHPCYLIDPERALEADPFCVSFGWWPTSTNEESHKATDKNYQIHQDSRPQLEGEMPRWASKSTNRVVRCALSMLPVDQWAFVWSALWNLLRNRHAQHRPNYILNACTKIS